MLIAAFVALFVSSVAGYGGSLILVPALAAILGPKQGIAMASLLLGWNNAFKLIAYRRTLALRTGWPLLVVTAMGVWFGARLLIDAPAHVAMWAIVAVTVVSLGVEVVGGSAALEARRHLALPAMAASSVLSGVSGSSGPLKGVAIRSLGLPRLQHVGLASCVSFVADAFKVELFASAGLFGDVNPVTIACALPMMPVGAWVGRSINERVDERAFRWIFWTVVGGYTMRMAGIWF